MEKVIKELALKLNKPEEVIKKAYRAYWKFIRTKAEELPLKEDLSEEEFKNLRVNFNIPNLGKLTCTYDRYVGMKRRNQIIKELYAKRKENKTNGKLLGDNQGSL